MRKTLAAITLFSIIFSGCAKMKLAFDVLPWAMERQAKKFVKNLRSEQKEMLQAETKAYVEWLRIEMLPAYSAGLRLIADGLANTTASRVGELLAPATLNGLYTATVEPLYSPSAELLASLDEAQIVSLEASLKKRADADEKLYLEDASKPLEKRIARLQSYLEDYFGPLNVVQVRRLRELSIEFPMPYQAWLRDRRERADKLCAMLREKRPRTEIEAHLRDWWTKARSAGRRREDYQWDDAQLRRFVNGVLIMVTPAQRHYASRKLSDLASQLDQLALPQPQIQSKPTAFTPSVGATGVSPSPAISPSLP